MIEAKVPEAEDVTVTEDTLRVELSDGRTISVPLAWYPRLVHAAQEERDAWELIGEGQGIRWAALDEDLSVEGLIAGRPSGESQRSLKRWLEARRAGRSVALSDITDTTRRVAKNGDEAPKYESFWKTTISGSSFRSAVNAAAKGATGRIAVDGIRECSPKKKNWYGIVRVRQRSIVPVSKGDLAAPNASLGKVLENDGMLAAWPTIVFRFTIDKAGDWLNVQKETP